MRVPDAGPNSADRLAAVLLILMAGGGLGLAGLGAFVVVKTKNDTANLPQPHLYTESDRDAERLAQLRSLATRQAVELALPPLPGVAVASTAVRPPSAALDSELKPSSSAPSAKLPSNEGRKQAEPLPNRHERHKVPAAPAAPASPVAAPPARDALVGYIVDEIAGLRIDLRGLASRITVNEVAVMQLRGNKGLYDWLALGVTLVGSVQGLLATVVLIFKMRRKILKVRRRPQAIAGSG